MPEDSIVSISLFCASIEEELRFNKLSKKSISKVANIRDVSIFFTEYARIVINAVLTKKVVEKINDKLDNDTLFELYWISTVINPELSWALKNNQVGREALTKASKDYGDTTSPLRERLPQIESFLRKNIKGQDKAIESILDVIYRNAAGLSDPDRPQAVLLFTGPSGVGKTLIAKTLAVALMEENPSIDSINSPSSFFRIDCTLYQQKHEISNLIGSPRGYVGSDLGSPLPDFIKQHPDGCVILIDELEKAHPSLHKMFMGLFDYGKIKDNNQTEIDARNVIFIMTSNAGSKEASDASNKNPLGFVENKYDINKITYESYKKKLEELLPPEFRGRIDEIVVFNYLDNNAFKSILDIEVNKLESRLKEQGINIKITSAAKKSILRESTSPEFGARKLSQCIKEKISKPLSRLLVNTDNKSFICRCTDGIIYIEEKDVTK